MSGYWPGTPGRPGSPGTPGRPCVCCSMLRKVPLPIDPIICGQYIEIAIPVKNAIEPVIDALDGHRGALLASSYEYPGRYTRWDMGFVDPPLVLVCLDKTARFHDAVLRSGR